MCGVAGVVGTARNRCIMTNNIAMMLNSQQGRGYDGAGGAFVYKGAIGEPIKRRGLVSSVYTENAVTTHPCDFAGVGMIRYATAGGVKGNKNVGPYCKTGNFSIALVHNGQFVNPVSIRQEILASGGKLDGTSDSELAAHLIANSSEPTIEKAIIEACNKLKGAYSMLVMTPEKMIATRDPLGIRPLSVAHVINGDGSFYLAASETCGLKIFGDIRVFDVEPGTMVVFDQRGYHPIRYAPVLTPKHCIFEYIYFARPDSYLDGIPVKIAREALGRALAIKCHDLDERWQIQGTVTVPESGVSAERGYHHLSGYPQLPALTVNRGASRMFMQTNIALRQLGIRLKRGITPEYIDGKRVAMVDDSTVRGDTGSQNSMYLRETGGAIQVHGRIPSPPIKHPCFFGIDISSANELVAARVPLEEIAHYMHADTWEYLTLEETCQAIGVPMDQLCHACMSGIYPIEIDPREVVRIRD